MTGKGVLWLLSVVFAACAMAQLTRGFISGTVQDSSGAAVAAVTVRITNRSTNLHVETTTNEAGIYRFVAVEPGAYDVEFSKPGFETFRIEQVEAGTAQEVVLNHVLRIPSVAAEVNVVATTGAIELSKGSPSLERRFDSQFIESLPGSSSGSLDFWELALLAPGAVRSADGIASRSMSINGQRRTAVNYSIDGVDNNEFFLNIPAAYPLREAVAQVQVQTSPYSAEFGRNSTQISLITRSGTNQFHGELFDYFSHSRFQPLSLQDKRAGLASAPFRDNIFGGSLGGPLVRNRTFFFLNLSGRVRRDSLSARTAMPAIIPTPTGYQDLARVPLAEGQGLDSRRAVLDSLAFFPDLYLNAPRFENVGARLVNRIPIEAGTVLIPFANSQDRFDVNFRIDHQFTSRDTLTARAFTAGAFNAVDTSGGGTNAQFGRRFSTSAKIQSRNHQFSYVRILTPRLTNEARAAYNRFDLDYRIDSSGPGIQVSGLFTLGPGGSYPRHNVSETGQFQDVISWLAGRHALKAGADIRRLRFYQHAANAQRGVWVFNNLQDFLNNQAQSLSQFHGNPLMDTPLLAQAYFVQDDFKAAPGLTFNLGLRYETAPAPFGYFGAILPEVLAVGVLPPVQPDRNNWAPRGGLAWSPPTKGRWTRRLLGDGRTVFRGGFGVAYNTLYLNISSTRNNYPTAQVLQSMRPDTINLFPRLAAAPAGNLPLNPAAVFTNLRPDAQSPTTNFFSFSIQRQFGADYIAEIGYTGSRNYHLTRGGQDNPAILTAAQAAQVIAAGSANGIPGVAQRRLNPAWGSRAIVETDAVSRYDALFLRLDRRLVRGLLLAANYTWSANFSQSDGTMAENPQDFACPRCDWSRSTMDRPHRFAVHYLYQLMGLARAPRAVKYLMGGWQVTGFSEWQSGQPFTVTTGVDSLGNGTALTARPDYNPNGAFALDPVTGDWRSFSAPSGPAGLFLTPRAANGNPLPSSVPRGGNLGRNTFRAPMFWNSNISLMKSFPIGDRWRLDLRGEFSNLFNHRNFGPPVASMNNADFGRNNSSPPGRYVQAVAKIRF